jgi:hypothetical protein
VKRRMTSGQNVLELDCPVMASGHRLESFPSDVVSALDGRMIAG